MGFFGYGSSNPHNWRNFIYGQSKWLYIFLFVLIVLLFYGMTKIGGKTTTYYANPWESAWIACTTYLEKETSLAASTAQEYSKLDVSLLSENSYKVNAHYPKMNAAYECTVENTLDGKWLVVKTKQVK